MNEHEIWKQYCELQGYSDSLAEKIRQDVQKTTHYKSYVLSVRAAEFGEEFKKAMKTAVKSFTGFRNGISKIGRKPNA